MTTRIAYETRDHHRRLGPGDQPIDVWDLLVRPVAGGIELDDGERVLRLTLEDAERLVSCLRRAFFAVKASERETWPPLPAAVSPLPAAVPIGVALGDDPTAAAGEPIGLGARLRRGDRVRAKRAIYYAHRPEPIEAGDLGIVLRDMQRPNGAAWVEWAPNERREGFVTVVVVDNLEAVGP